MHRLLTKSEINGTCWVEFNVSGDATSYEHWHPSSRYASLDAIDSLYSVFSQAIHDFDLYSPVFLRPQVASNLSKMLDTFASSNIDHPAKNFAVETSFFLAQNYKKHKAIWVLGV